MIQKLLESIISAIYPRMCFECERPIESFGYGSSCGSCWEKARIFTGDEPQCAKCGTINKASVLSASDSGIALCGRCNDHQYDKVFCAGEYSGALKSVVLNLKEQPFIGKRGETAFVETYDRIRIDFDLVIPIPLSKRRLKERGFNQAEVLANVLRKQRGVTVVSDFLSRVVHTPMHRTGMDVKAREATVKRAFAVNDGKSVAGKNILLIDDVFTSGATSSQCAQVLKKAGATSVRVLAFARTR